MNEYDVNPDAMSAELAYRRAQLARTTRGTAPASWRRRWHRSVRDGARHV